MLERQLCIPQLVLTAAETFGCDNSDSEWLGEILGSPPTALSTLSTTEVNSMKKDLPKLFPVLDGDEALTTACAVMLSSRRLLAPSASAGPSAQSLQSKKRKVSALHTGSSDLESPQEPATKKLRESMDEKALDQGSATQAVAHAGSVAAAGMGPVEHRGSLSLPSPAGTTALSGAKPQAQPAQAGAGGPGAGGRDQVAAAGVVTQSPERITRAAQTLSSEGRGSAQLLRDVPEEATSESAFLLAVYQKYPLRLQL